MANIKIDLCLTDIDRSKVKAGKNGKNYVTLFLAERKEVGKYGETHNLSTGKREDGTQGYCGSGKYVTDEYNHADDDILGGEQ